MGASERVVEALNRAFHHVLEEEPNAFFLGEDVLDPYGGAFKASRGLSTRFPERVLTTPISEQSLVGLGGGLALCGNKPIVEMMFGDFVALGFDQILNFASKSVAMYGRTLPMNLVVRCAVGAQRGYGPTHSQSLQKHFIGIPHLSLWELSAFHDPVALLRRLVNLGHPSLLFEDKVLYAQRMHQDGVVDDLFGYRFLDDEQIYAHVVAEAFERPSHLIIAPGGVAARCLAAARHLFLEQEIESQIIVPARLHPFDVAPLRALVRASEHILVVEGGVAGGGWGAEVAQRIYEDLWDELAHPIHLIHSRDSIIPTASHLEKQVIVQEDDIRRAMSRAVSQPTSQVGARSPGRATLPQGAGQRSSSGGASSARNHHSQAE
jgi:pyruvate/2-oxoglutarate/acetoin dehydrogenase E1 component